MMLSGLLATRRADRAKLEEQLFLPLQSLWATGEALIVLVAVCGV